MSWDFTSPWCLVGFGQATYEFSEVFDQINWIGDEIVFYHCFGLWLLAMRLSMCSHGWNGFSMPLTMFSSVCGQFHECLLPDTNSLTFFTMICKCPSIFLFHNHPSGMQSLYFIDPNWIGNSILRWTFHAIDASHDIFGHVNPCWASPMAIWRLVKHTMQP